MVIPLGQLFSRTSDGIDTASYGRIRSMFATNLTNQVNHCLTSLSAWKGSQRTNLIKHYSSHLILADKAHNKTEVKLRVMRSFKVALFNEYCNQVLEEVYASSIKYNIVA